MALKACWEAKRGLGWAANGEEDSCDNLKPNERTPKNFIITFVDPNILGNVKL